MSKVITVFFILLNTWVYAQKFELGKVSKEELKENVHPLDSSASAAILYKKGNSYFDINGVNWILVTEVEVRLKIYKLEGNTYAHVAIPYQIDGKKAERVVFSDAVTYNLEGSKIVKTRLGEDAQFIEDVTDTKKIKKITLPNVTVGSIIEYKYVIKSANISSFPVWYFQATIPVNNIEYNVAIPQRFSYNKTLHSDFPVTENVSSQSRTIQLLYSNMKSVETKKTYIANNIPAFSGKNHIDDIDKLASLRYDLVNTEEIKATDAEIAYPVNWEKIIKSLYYREEFGEQLKKDFYFEKDIIEVLRGKMLPEDKMVAVFDFVKKRMAWNEYGGYRCEGNIEKAYAKRTGNSGEINLMLVAMLRYAGLNASPVVLSTRKNIYSEIYGRSAFNYVLAGVELQGKVILLDATSKNTMPNVVPPWAITDMGRLMRSNLTSMDVSITPQTSSLENVVIMAKIEENGGISGQIKTKKCDYNALRFRDAFSDINKSPHIKEEYIGQTETRLNSIEIDSFGVTNIEDQSKPVEESFNFKSNTLCEVIDGKIYIPSMLMYSLTKNPFIEEERSDSLNFLFPYTDKYVISITIPDGYVAEFVPEPVFIYTKGDICTFKFNVAVNGNQIQVIAAYNLLKTEVAPEYYETIKEFYANMVKKQTEKIVLVKKA